MWRYLTVLGVAAGTLALPFIFRQQEPAGDWRPGDPTLIIVSAHNEAIRYEFGRAFSEWYRQRHGRPVKVDWLNIGGATEISRYLNAEFAASHRTTTRIDLFFGGGEYDHTRAFQQGLTESPWPDGQPPFDPDYPATMSGETWRTPNWWGTTLSTFGICYNRDRLRDLGVTQPPAQWRDLTDPVYFGQVGVADPTKSGSMAKAFEMIIQQQMHEPDLDKSWADGLRVVQMIGANARYFTDSAGKVPIDVDAGDAAVGLAIDFYARFEARMGGHNRMVYVTPVGGSSVSADPISLLRGAPSREVAVRFIEFVLSREGQSLWSSPVGKPCSTVQKYELCRLPIREDMYPLSCPPDDPPPNPYELAKSFTYRPEWTGKLFNVQRDLIRAMCLDAGIELRAAWRTIIANGGPAKQPAAMQELGRMPVTWTEARTLKGDRLDLLRQWTEFYRENYRNAQEIVERASRSFSDRRQTGGTPVLLPE